MRSRTNSKTWLLSILLVLPALWSGSVSAFDRVRDESVINSISTMTIRYFVIQPQSSYLFWTSNLAPAPGGISADPFMHVAAIYGLNGLKLSNDDCTQPSITSYPNSCVLLENPTTEYAYVEVVVHAYATSTAAIGTLNALGPGLNTSEAGLEFGGQSLSQVTDDIGWGASDRIHVVRPPNHLPAGVDYKLLVLGAPGSSPCSHNSVKLLALGGSPEGVQLPSASSSYCRAQVIIGATGGGIAARGARLYINDAPSADRDGDGLGDQLEAELDTCPCQVFPGGCTTPPCTGACAPGVNPDACDFSVNAQDTDGDGLRDDWEVLGLSQLFLPRWGADPRRKDAFIELDWNSAVVNPGAPMGANPMNASVAAKFAQPYQAANGIGANNPDGTPGVRIHMDIGLDSCSATGVNCCKLTGLNCSTLYGDWGGGKQIAGNEFVAASTASMATNRRGVFFYGLFPSTAGGTANAWRFMAGHGRSEDSRARLLAHEFGHVLGAHHWGDPNGIQSLICKPNYPSTMSYAIPGHVPPPFFFSDGSRPDLISTSLNERDNSGIDYSYLQDFFGLVAFSSLSQVDWNRNGTIEPADSQGDALVSAVTAWGSQGDGCLPGFIHVNEVNVGTLDATRRPSIASTSPPNEALHGFMVFDNRDMRHRVFSSNLTPCTIDPNSTDQNGSPDFCCPTGSNNLNGCSGWSPSDFLLATDVDSSPAAILSHSTNGLQTVVVAYTRNVAGTRAMRLRRVLGSNNYATEVSLASLPLPTIQPAKEADPSMVWVEGATQSQRRLHIFYLESDRTVRQAIVRDDGSTLTLVSDQRVLVGGTALKSLYAPGAFFDVVTGKIVLGLVNNDSNDRYMRFFTAVGQPGTSFVAETLPQGRKPLTDGPISISRSSEGLSQLEIVYPWAGGLRRMWARNGFNISLDRDIFDSHAVGRVGLSVANFRGRLQFASVCPSCANNAGRLQHHPFASGIFPFVEEDVDDFRTFDEEMCRRLKLAPGANLQLCVTPGASTSALTYIIPVGKCR